MSVLSILAHEEGQRLDSFLARELPELPRSGAFLPLHRPAAAPSSAGRLPQNLQYNRNFHCIFPLPPGMPGGDFFRKMEDAARFAAKSKKILKETVSNFYAHLAKKNPYDKLYG